MARLSTRQRLVVCWVLVWLVLPASRSASAAASTLAIWNRIAEDAVVRAGAFQNEGLIYMAYVSAAVYDAVVAIKGGYTPYGGGVTAPAGASVDAAIVEAAYRTLVHYLPGETATVEPLYTAALAAIPDGPAKSDGLQVGTAASNLVIAVRTNDGRKALTSSSTFPTKPEGPGVWRLTPTAFAAPQTPWVGDVRPFLVDSAGRFLPDPPPSLQSFEWVEAYKEIKDYGSATSPVRSQDQTQTARFWTANVIRQYNQVLRDVIDSKALSALESARLQAMVNMVGADAQIAVMHAKYHYLFWRPVTAIDPRSVKPSGDGFGKFPEGYDDGNTATAEQTDWRPIAPTPNHPEYPAAHGSITSAMAEVFREFLGTNRINLPIHGFDPAGPSNNLDAVRTFATPADWRNEIVDARVWAGFHYRFSGVEGVVLGRKVARAALRESFRPIQ